MKNYWVLKSIKMLFLMAFFIVLLGSVVMWLWNWLMPSLFNLPVISFSQALGLTVLSRILAGGFRLGAGSVGSSEHWEQKRQLWDKWSGMSAEERQRWKEEWRSRCRHSRSNAYQPTEEEKMGSDQI